MKNCTRKQAMEIFGISYLTLFNWIKQGKLFEIKDERGSFIPGYQIRNLINEKIENYQQSIDNLKKHI